MMLELQPEHGYVLLAAVGGVLVHVSTVTRTILCSVW